MDQGLQRRQDAVIHGPWICIATSLLPLRQCGFEWRWQVSWLAGLRFRPPSQGEPSGVRPSTHRLQLRGQLRLRISLTAFPLNPHYSGNHRVTKLT
jgi:hypothetical protein